MNVAHVVTDREGGWVAVEPVKKGQLVAVLRGISPPIKVRRRRQLTRAGIRGVLFVNACVLMLSITFTIWIAILQQP
jgi:hypothetical protein